MAQVTKIGEFANTFEQDIITYLGSHLPQSFEIIHNLEIPAQSTVYELDAVILAPHCVFVVDIKGTKGRIEIRQGKWYPYGRMGLNSPVAKLRQHAKTLNTLIKSHNYARPELGRVHIEPVVILRPEVEIDDDRQIDEPWITYADDRSRKYLEDQDRVPSGRLTDIQPYRSMVRLAIVGKATPPNPLPCFQNWKTEKVLDRTDDYTDYLAHETFAPLKKMRLRAYPMNWLMDAQEREQQRKLLSRSYQALSALPSYPHILPIKTCFETPDQDFLVLVQEELTASPIHQFAQQQSLDRDQFYRWVSDILTALDLLHQHQVLHRNLTPDQVLITPEGQLYLTGFDYARLGRNQTTIAQAPEVVAALAAKARYHAPECYEDPSQASPQSDLFSAGVIFYEVLTGQCPFTSAEDIFDRHAQFPQPASSLSPHCPPSLDSWLQSLCAFQPADRPPSADSALKTFAQLTAPPPEPVPAPALEFTPLDLCNLQPGDTLKNHYTIVERLGEPGGFAVVYRVIDSWTGSQEQEQVIKLVYRDRESVYDRLMQEYQALKAIPEHPYIVKCITADDIPAQPGQEAVPYIIFEYIAGESVENWKTALELPLEQVITLGRQVAQGLAHLHRHGVYHQDIKPENLFWTEKGVKIIDFNIAAFEDTTEPLSAGTRRYLPPDLSKTAALDNHHRADRDLYALGITLYECLTQGGYPFEAEAPLRGIKPKDPRQCETCLPEVTDAFAKWLLQVLAPHQADRFSTAEAFLAALDRAIGSSTPEIPPIAALQNLSETSSQRVGVVPPWLPSSVENPGNHGGIVPGDQNQGNHGGLAPGDQNQGNHGGIAPTQLVLPKGDSPRPTASPIAPDPFRDGPAIILDPTKRIPVPSHCQPIASEVDWLHHCPSPWNVPARPLWVQGKQLCDWVHSWLTSWDHLDWIADRPDRPSLSRPEEENLPDSVLNPKKKPDLPQKAPSYLPNPAHNDLPPQLTGSSFPLRPSLASLPSREHPAPFTPRPRPTVPPCPAPLVPNAEPAVALAWVTEQYLPFRLWEVAQGVARADRRSTAIADSFVTWLLAHYPTLKEAPTADSWLNYNVAAHVDTLSQAQPVLWVVVDGLGWLDHQELLDILLDNTGNSLKLQSWQPLTPRFSILPTLTGYAKWSLFSQKLPQDPSWVAEAGKGFPQQPGYKRYTRSQTDKLYKALRKGKYQVYCWDTVEFDEAFHKYSDWQSWQSQERPRLLRSIATQIRSLIAAYPHPDRLAVVISSDHGQILGTIPHLFHQASDLKHQGRTLLGDIEDDRFVVLEADRFGLPHRLSIVRSDEGLGYTSYANTAGESQGSHGGLFPEEVVIGYSILTLQVEYLPLQVSLSGQGCGDQPGTFTLTVHNPNPVPLEQPVLTIDQLPTYATGVSLPVQIPAQSTTPLSLPLDPWPTTLDPSQSYRLTGHLTGSLGAAPPVSTPLSPDSALTIQQIFTSKGPSLTDFL